ncbi:aminopeptidase M1-like protein isoform X1, partial [Tanacetum coccineum]
ESGSSEVVVDKDTETLLLVFDEALDVGDVLGCLFCRLLERSLAGLMLTYVDGGVRKNMAVTQFKPADARRCFPCWDQPVLKASVPDFSGGTMENYGLITYREAELLHDDLHSTAQNTQRLSIVVTHEVGQQWFGTWMWVCCKFRIVNAFSTDDLLSCNGNLNIPSLSSLNLSLIVTWRLANLLGYVVPFCHTGCLDLLFSSAAVTF